MGSCYVTWNKNEYPEFLVKCKELKSGSQVEIDWKFTEKSVKKGDRLYVYSTDYKGFVSSGVVISDRFFDDKKISWVKIKFDFAPDFENEIFLQKRTLDNIFSNQNWVKQGSGHMIEQEYAVAIEDAWADIVGYSKDIVNLIRVAEPIDSDKHDGSYELVRESVTCYSALTADELSKAKKEDFDYLWYASTINANKDNYVVRLKKTILPQASQDYLMTIIEKIWDKAEQKEYLNHKDEIQVGMFDRGGSGTLKGFKDVSGPLKMLKILIDIYNDTTSMTTNSVDYNGTLYDEIKNELNVKVNCFKISRFSQLAHCIKPNLFPVVNNNPGLCEMYKNLGININEENTLAEYGEICKKFKELKKREMLNFISYRVPDLVAYSKLGRSDIDFIKVADYLKNNYEINPNGIPYRKPNSESNINEKKKLNELSKKGQKASEIMIQMARACEQFGLKQTGQVKWLDASGTKTKNYLWAQMTFPNYKNECESISIKCQLNDSKNKIFGYSFELEIVNSKAKNDINLLKRHHKFLDLQLDKVHNLVYLSGTNEIKSADEAQKIYKGILEDTDSSSWNGDKIKIGRLINCDGKITNEKIYNAMIESVKALIPYYKHVMGISDLKGKSNPGGNAMNTNRVQDTIKKYIDKGYKQIILTGAPGTGKTYSVKEFTGMGNNTKFVQFHPSFDYSDFVEGLRPVQLKTGGEPTFVRIDGIFKKFCRYVVEQNYKKKYKNELKNIAGENEIAKYIKFIKEYSDLEDDEDDKYFFVIDEINRADLSKVFGELMYCLEDSYRGLKDKNDKFNIIETQYNNLETYSVENGITSKIPFDCFLKGFFIPKNIYIIGTMNDIDRSVESFDFALRRRFEWIDIKANEVFEDGVRGILSDKIAAKTITDEAIKDLTNKVIKMNEVISNDDNQFMLTEAYHIGHAYFKNFDGTNASIKEIFETNVTSILKEYTRGRKAKDVEDNLLSKCREALGIN